MADSHLVFKDSRPLKTRVEGILEDGSERLEVRKLVSDLYSDVSRLENLLQSQENTIKNLQASLSEATNPGKRKVTETTPAAGENGKRLKTEHAQWTNVKVVCSAKDVSCSVPVRKKLNLEFVQGDSREAGGIRALNPASGDTEYALGWDEVEQVVLAPVPEKAQPAYSYVVLPAPNSSTLESLVWTVTPSGAPKGFSFGSGDSVGEDDTPISVFDRALNQHLGRYGKHIVKPDGKVFISSIVQAHRKNEKAFHVKAFRGSKDGFLYFLPTGILFGFKKPILYFPFSLITSISYSSILQRTFNLTITACLQPSATSSESAQASQEDTTDYEFSMLDQADFSGVDAYVKGHGLNDASLAASRRAQRYNVNSKPQAKATNGVDGPEVDGVDGDEEGGELAKAERELQDAEDEEEEDYSPEEGGGDSDGSGTDSEDEALEYGSGDDAEHYEEDEGTLDDDM
ncbi:MAG: hypothetical protein M1831_006659 [Alyxoria varia]|nr:MAG: hypothetical protein M1831_006659 [Alyxoria varia]